MVGEVEGCQGECLRGCLDSRMDDVWYDSIQGWDWGGVGGMSLIPIIQGWLIGDVVLFVRKGCRSFKTCKGLKQKNAV